MERDYCRRLRQQCNLVRPHHLPPSPPPLPLQVESDYYERLGQRCNQERLQKQRLSYSWSHREEARKMRLPACEEYELINKKLGVRAY